MEELYSNLGKLIDESTQAVLDATSNQSFFGPHESAANLIETQIKRLKEQKQILIRMVCKEYHPSPR
jgi:hypothetical protein